ncbi:tyrosine-type recombinase/integrase [Brevundimonas mediterranea]|uniref:Tyrosine recombinase XerD n=1 Tax=Brevundimonas mediterranea TaxID=74329 RepID=A0A7Z8Y351_9CAUL|nr:tyrosine-type recombinase/integrase [Brevundimonas mediterranea]VDC50062.1 Tyrosine recombinase XerD [Brevundimonas mediterranea]
MSAAAMQARAAPEPPDFLSHHCSAEEYDAFLARCDVAKHFVQQRRSHRKLFVEAWPDLNAWLRAPLAERIGRINGQTRRTLHNPPSYWARAYLYYLALSGHLRIDYDWLLAVGDVCVHDVVHHMRIDLGVEVLAREASVLGLGRPHVDCAMRWTLGRIALHSGVRRVDQLVDADVDRMLVAVRRFGERPDLADYWGSAERYRTVSKPWVTMIGQLRLVLYHRGQVHEPPRKIMPSAVVRAAQPAMGVLVEKWLERRAPTLRPATLYHLALTVRSFLDHLAATAPAIQTFAAVKHQHVVSWMNAMATDPSLKTGRPLTPHSQRGRVVRLAQFYKDAEDWAWADVPRWPLVARRDLPRQPERIPRYIPRADLDRLMGAIRALPDPFQRAAMIVARWSGARMGEVRRLTTDCLDSYPDGTARLRIPVGKTARERVIPLHDEAADALRTVFAMRATVADRNLPDERTGDLVRFVFVWRGKLMSERHLFGTPLKRVCDATGLVDAFGKPTITMHRFRHTLAERGAKLHTIMSILGHESPQMTMVYARISDAEVLRDYRSVLEPGAVIAGVGAEAIRAGTLAASAVDWLRTNFLKTELELGHCLRLPSEGPCECDLYLSCSRFVTTPAYVPRLRERHRLELSLADDARERSWPREVERHCAVARRVEQLLTDLGNAKD